MIPPSTGQWKRRPVSHLQFTARGWAELRPPTQPVEAEIMKRKGKSEMEIIKIQYILSPFCVSFFSFSLTAGLLADPFFILFSFVLNVCSSSGAVQDKVNISDLNFILMLLFCLGDCCYENNFGLLFGRSNIWKLIDPSL